MTNIFNEPPGLLKTGSITGYNNIKKTIKVVLSTASSLKGSAQPIEVPAPYSLFYNNGLFIGALPKIGTPIIIGQGSGGKYYFVSFLVEDLNQIPNLNDGELLISTQNTKILLDNDSNIIIGNDSNNIHIDTNYNLISTNFDNENHFTQASRKIEGLVKRDLQPNTNFDDNTKLINDNYDSQYTVIGLDTSLATNSLINSNEKNPPFIESREILYEFKLDSNIINNLSEATNYSIANNEENDIYESSYTLPNRRKSRADTLSLSLVEPNYLMEIVKGTVIDIFGNILDINRYPIPIGIGQNTIKSTSNNKETSFNLIKELERKSLAFHFEINARKNLTDGNLPDITSNADYSRSRSRFFFDIDKEGQFKLNVPASSETGNVSLLTRYENYSSFGPEDNGNPNKLFFRDDNLDIFQDSFAANHIDYNNLNNNSNGSVSLLNYDGSNAAPVDRITNTNIKYGTAYHDILNTCISAQHYECLQFVSDIQNEIFNPTAIKSIPLLTNVVSNTIITSGPNSNAGGRSANISLDGSLDLNIGANTVDRQSIILDTAGGIIANIGRDRNNKSGIISMDGDFFLNIGGKGISNDSRFLDLNNGNYGGTLDIRVISSGGFATMIRIDDTGVKILTPGVLAIHGESGIDITSDGNINIDCESLILQNRLVTKNSGGSI